MINICLNNKDIPNDTKKNPLCLKVLKTMFKPNPTVSSVNNANLFLATWLTLHWLFAHGYAQNRRCAHS